VAKRLRLREARGEDVDVAPRAGIDQGVENVCQVMHACDAKRS